jgi:hypothetical protein
VRHEGAHPELDPPAMISNLLNLEDEDYSRSGQEGQEAFLVRLLFSMWGKDKVESILTQVDIRANLYLDISASQLERFSSVLP